MNDSGLESEFFETIDCAVAEEGWSLLNEAPEMPTEQPRQGHRELNPHGSWLPLIPACIARPVGRKEIATEPAAQAAVNKEWRRLVDRPVWDMNTVREWDDVANEARNNGKQVHFGRVFGI